MSESAWTGSSGGFSKNFLRPWYQNDMHTNEFRGVPDVAAHADPNTGYTICFDKTCQIIGGKKITKSRLDHIEPRRETLKRFKNIGKCL